jgi:flagellar biosynthesis protein FliR
VIDEHGASMLAGAALVLARVGGLCATAPLIGDATLPHRVRLGLTLVLTCALAPLRSTQFTDAGDLVAPLLAEVALGLGSGTVARLALASIEVAGQLIGVSLGLGFAAQYDALRTETGEVGRALAHTLAALAFLGAGGLEAVVRAAASPASLAELTSVSQLALQLGSRVATDGLTLAAPILLAALVANLGVALVHRAAAAINVFAVGLGVSLLVGGFALLASSSQLVNQARMLAERAVQALAEQP